MDSPATKPTGCGWPSRTLRAQAWSDDTGATLTQQTSNGFDNVRAKTRARLRRITRSLQCMAAATTTKAINGTCCHGPATRPDGSGYRSAIDSATSSSELSTWSSTEPLVRDGLNNAS